MIDIITPKLDLQAIDQLDIEGTAAIDLQAHQAFIDAVEARLQAVELAQHPGRSMVGGVHQRQVAERPLSAR